MMLINFCYSQLMQSATSDVLSSEGFELSNLLSTDCVKKNKGFLAERFVGPPARLTFVFVCEVNINHIVILTEVGSQKSIGIEVLTKALDSTEYPVISGVLKQPEKGFFFHKHGYDMNKALPEHHKSLSFRTFKSFRYLKTRTVIVKIFKTLNSTIPALGKIEIWGYPSRNSPKGTIDSIYQVWRNIQLKQDISKVSPNSSLVVNSRVKVPVSEASCNNKSLSDKNSEQYKLHLNQVVPEEFIDPITCEIMVLPIILPSGKIIDSFTLEKHNEAESKWGRGASDPFTGKLLTEHNKTIFASDLKFRIDKFLSEHSNEPVFKCLPRTVGRKFNYIWPSVTSLSKRNCLDHKQKMTRPVEVECQKTFSFQCNKSSSNGTVENSDKFLIKPKEHTSTQERLNNSPNKCCLTANTSNNNYSLGNNSVLSLERSDIQGSPNFKHTNNKQRIKLKTSSYEEQSESALEFSLKRTLSSLPSCSDMKIKQTINITCSKCSSNEYLFKIPCAHFLCRRCLLTIMKHKYLKCFICQNEFQTSDPQRFHL